MPDLPATVTLRAGEEKTLRLPSLAGAGYRWEATAEDDSVAAARAEFDHAVTAADGRTSFSEDELLTLHGRRVGTTRVRCVQRRGWESDAPPVAEHSITVTVVPAAAHKPVDKEATNGP
jgi:predicted secreted protein